MDFIVFAPPLSSFNVSGKAIQSLLCKSTYTSKRPIDMVISTIKAGVYNVIYKVQTALLLTI